MRTDPKLPAIFEGPKNGISKKPSKIAINYFKNPLDKVPFGNDLLPSVHPHILISFSAIYPSLPDEQKFVAFAVCSAQARPANPIRHLP